MTIRIAPDGALSFIYQDGLRPLLELGEARIKRASHVEPTPDGRWQADLTPIGGPTLDRTNTRADSLQAETEWITQHYLGGTAPV